MFFKSKKNKEEIRKKVSVNIFFYDGSNEIFSQIHPIQSNISPELAFFNFYKWFFCRKNSEGYTFQHKEGSTAFYRKDIKMIKFLSQEILV